jgi:hypothetical protein
LAIYRRSNAPIFLVIETVLALPQFLGNRMDGRPLASPNTWTVRPPVFARMYASAACEDG